MTTTNDIAYDIIMECIDNLTEDDAMTVVTRIFSTFGFAGTYFTRGDAETAWQNWCEANGEDSTGEMPDEVWNEITLSSVWRKWLPDTLVERGWDLVHDAVTDAMEHLNKKEN